MQRFVEPVLAAIRSAGHDVAVSVEAGALPTFEAVPDVTVTRLNVPRLRADRSGLRGVRLLRALASYAALRRRWHPLMQRRWLEYFPHSVSRVLRLLGALRLAWLVDNSVARALLMWLASSARPPSTLSRQLEAMSPDAVLMTPMIYPYPGTRELDVVPLARRRGIPTFGLVLSWDNLTSKSTFHVRPDTLLVWNEAQRREAEEWHGFDRSSIEVVGAPVFDYVFEEHRRPERDAVLRTLGLGDEDRYVLYAVSSKLGLGPGGEAEIVRNLAVELEDATWIGPPPTLVVRPHPRNTSAFDRLIAANVVVAPPSGFPDGDAARTELLGLVWHAEAVVGLNTSLFIEAAILETPVVAMSLRGYVAEDVTPANLTHFEHLRRAGFIYHVDGPAQAAAALSALRDRGDEKFTAQAAFVSEFVRPRGLHRSAAGLVVERLTSSR